MTPFHFFFFPLALSSPVTCPENLWPHQNSEVKRRLRPKPKKKNCSQFTSELKAYIQCTVASKHTEVYGDVYVQAASTSTPRRSAGLAVSATACNPISNLACAAKGQLNCQFVISETSEPSTVFSWPLQNSSGRQEGRNRR